MAVESCLWAISKINNNLSEITFFFLLKLKKSGGKVSQMTNFPQKLYYIILYLGLYYRIRMDKLTEIILNIILIIL